MTNAGNYRRPFELPVRMALIPLPAGAVEPQGWLRDRCLAARDGYTGHMDDVHEDFRRAWAADHTMTGNKLSSWQLGAWPYEGGGYWFDGLVRLGYALHDEALIRQAQTRLGAVADRMKDKGISFFWWLDRRLSYDDPDGSKIPMLSSAVRADWPVTRIQPDLVRIEFEAEAGAHELRIARGLLSDRDAGIFLRFRRVDMPAFNPAVRPVLPEITRLPQANSG
jgi:hypothetical protein